eukprot:162002_1
MGCVKSKPSVLSHLDDSVKVMVRHDTEALKKRGQKPGGYVPRAPHPLLQNKKVVVTENNNETDNYNDNDNINNGTPSGTSNITPNETPVGSNISNGGIIEASDSMN